MGVDADVFYGTAGSGINQVLPTEWTWPEQDIILVSL